MKALPIAVLLILLAGCATPHPDPAATAPPGPVMQKAWQWNTTADLGDWYMQVTIHLDEAAHCGGSQYSQGTSSPHVPFGVIGMVSGSATTVQGSYRSGWGGAHVGPADTDATPGPYWVNPHDHDDDFFPFTFGMAVAAGNATAFWSAKGIHKLSTTTEPATMRVELTCNRPFSIVGKAVSHAPLLFDDLSFNGTTVNTLSIAPYADGILDLATPSNATLFAFSELTGARQQALSLSSAAGNEDWDMSGNKMQSVGRLGLAGPFHLHFTRLSEPIYQNLRAPWFNGILVAYEPVERLPGEV